MYGETRENKTTARLMATDEPRSRQKDEKGQCRSRRNKNILPCVYTTTAKILLLRTFFTVILSLLEIQ